MHDICIIHGHQCAAIAVAQVPIMLRSSYCSLSGLDDRELTQLGECPYDQVGILKSHLHRLPHVGTCISVSVPASKPAHLAMPYPSVMSATAKREHQF